MGFTNRKKVSRTLTPIEARCAADAAIIAALKSGEIDDRATGLADLATDEAVSSIVKQQGSLAIGTLTGFQVAKTIMGGTGWGLLASYGSRGAIANAGSSAVVSYFTGDSPSEMAENLVIDSGIGVLDGWMRLSSQEARERPLKRQKSG